MSDAVDDLDFHAKRLLDRSKTSFLRRRMKSFSSERGGEADLKQLRKEVSDGRDVSDVVAGGREERL